MRIGLERDAHGDDADQRQGEGAADQAVFGADQLLDAVHELASMGGLREGGGGRGGRCRRQAVERGERQRDPARVVEHVGGESVGDVLAFDADPV